MIIIEEFSGVETKLCVGGAAFQTLVPLTALLVYALIVHLLVVYKQQFYLQLQHIFDVIRNGTVCAQPWLLCCRNILAAMKGLYSCSYSYT